MTGELDSARRFQASVRDVLDRHAMQRADWRSLRRIQALCRQADDSTDDEYCRTKIHLVSEYAAELLAHEDHCKWDCGTMSGAEFLRRQILAAAELYCSRVFRLTDGARILERGVRGRAHEERIGL